MNPKYQGLRHSRLNMRHLLSFPLILVVFVVVTADQTPTNSTQLHLDKSHHEEAQVGSNVTLWCNFTTKPPAQLGLLTVHWTKDGVSILFLNKTYIQPNSTPISEEKLQKGDASLSLSHVSREDTGIYICSIQYGTKRESLIVTLRILDDPDSMGQKNDGSSMKHGAAVGPWCVALLLVFGYKP
ncbi:V-set and immunoglobulin domain-containing protein 1 [Xenopus laevis]|uniref:V-set and immunoglobulin domain-containing protein 1 n=1 Tax=Xenopus laevis TaxID=8355 RepID=UPI001BB12D18|nr:V-set and immunoglobulin domain-containing protein 1 [Xenopus laevis]